MSRSAAFLDRDGTIIDDVSYIARPEQVRLRPDVAAAMRQLRDAGKSIIVITNQSGIARGLLTQDDYERVQARMLELLAGEGTQVDASYMCPHHPDFGDTCECRKPGTLLFRRAASEQDLDLARSLFIGDRWRDVAPAQAFGGRGLLIAGESTPTDERRRAEEAGMDVVGTLLEAVQRGLRA